jgi:antitoxin component HigA of HigAB toxin-antitoxin module
MMTPLMTQPIRSHLSRWLAGPQGPAPTPTPIIPDDLRVEANGAVYDAVTGHLDYLWFEITERLPEGERRTCKALRLAMLTYLPDQDREQATLLIEMQKAVKAVNTAQLDLIGLAANILEPDLGVVQIYGAQATGQTRGQAAQAAAQAYAVVMATLRAAYEQSVFQPLTSEIAAWLQRAFERMPYALVVALVVALVGAVILIRA